MAPFAFALIGDMPYGAVREAPFARLVAEINRDNDIDFVMHAGDIIRSEGSRAARVGCTCRCSIGGSQSTHYLMFATVHVVASNNGLEPWLGIDPTDSCTTARPDRTADLERRQDAALAWLDEVFASAAGTNGLFLLIQANPYKLPSDPQNCPSGFEAFLGHLETLAQQYAKPVVLAHGDDHFSSWISLSQTWSFRECRRSARCRFTG